VLDRIAAAQPAAERLEVWFLDEALSAPLQNSPKAPTENSPGGLT
jgi:hypothetical protein